MIILYTDFGWHGPYIGQIKAVLHAKAANVPVIDLMHDAPVYRPKASAYLLASLFDSLPKDAILLGIVDPGVGDPARRPVIVKVDGRWLVGPDNGLFNVVASRSKQVQWWDITWRPEKLSSSFHGRDLFAPVAVMIANGTMPAVVEQAVESRLMSDWPEDLAEVIYIDHYGNCITGLRAAQFDDESEIEVGKYSVSKAKTFSDVPKGRAFWFENSNGMVEIAINMGNASHTMGIKLGDEIIFAE